MKNEKKEYISGIYNYCDRWCEKCRFTANCRLFSTESKINTYRIMNNGKLPEAEDIFDMEFNDIENNENEFDEEDFWDDEEDFDVEEDENEEKILKGLEGKKECPVEKLSVEYLNKAHSFVKALDEKFNFTEASAQRKDDPRFKKLLDAFDVINWYHMFIMVKIKRAIDGKSEIQIGMDEEDNEFQSYDMNGSAKIAAIAINRSQDALNDLLSLTEEFNFEIEELMVLLGKILNEVDREFPDYKKFTRPGFDTDH